MATETEIEAALDGFYMRQADSMHDRMAAAVAALDRVRADDTRPQDEDHETEPHQAERAWVKELVDTHRPWQIVQSMNDLVDRAELAEAEVARLRATEPHQADTQTYQATKDLLAEVARLRAERDEAVYARDHASSDAYERGYKAGREARVAELEAERDLARDAIRAQNERQIAELRKAKEGVQDRIDRAVTERTEAMVESAERCLNDWGRGAGIGGMGRFVYEHLRREFPVPTRTREASDGD